MFLDQNLIVGCLIGFAIMLALRHWKLNVPILNPEPPRRPAVVMGESGPVMMSQPMPPPQQPQDFGPDLPPLAACFDWFVRAGAGVIQPTRAEMKTVRAIKPHIDALLAEEKKESV